MKHKNFLPKHHTAKLVHRHHTAYGYLVLVLIFAFVPLLAVSASVAAQPGDPVNADEGVYAVVPAPVPSQAPSIRSIVSGQVFTSAELLSVSGSCPANTVVNIFKNQVMAGSDLCKNGAYSIKIDLFFGANSITARAYNINGIAGPDSEPVNVKLTPHGSNGLTTDSSNQLVVTSDVYIKGVHTNDTLKWPLTITGGQAPYAVSVGWGDDKSDLISRGEAGTFEVHHIYDSPGKGERNSNDIVVQVTDQQGNKAFLHLVTLVSGPQAGVVGTMKAGYNLSTAIRIGWQLLLLGAVIIAGFWFGKQYELHVLKRKYNINP